MKECKIRRIVYIVFYVGLSIAYLICIKSADKLIYTQKKVIQKKDSIISEYEILTDKQRATIIELRAENKIYREILMKRKY